MCYRSVEPSGNYTAIIPVSDVGVPEAVVLDWDYQSSVVNPFSWRIVAPRVYIEYIKVESLDFNLRFVDFEQMSNFHKKKQHFYLDIFIVLLFFFCIFNYFPVSPIFSHLPRISWVFIMSSLVMCPIFPNEPVVAGTPSEFRRLYCNTYRNLP